MFFLAIVSSFFSHFLHNFYIISKKKHEKWTQPEPPPPPQLWTKSIHFCNFLERRKHENMPSLYFLVNKKYIFRPFKKSKLQL